MAKTKTKPKTKSYYRKQPSYRGMRDKRYRKTEEAILEVLLKAKKMPSTTELTKRARISRSTLYRHHRAIPGIIPDYEHDITIVFKQEVSSTLKRRRDATIESIYLKILFFVLRYKRVFKILFKYSGDRVVENMVLAVKDLIAINCHLPKNSDRLFKIYAKEVAGIVEDWNDNDFSEHEINRILKDIVYLTTTMKQRLAPIRR
ncbi:hypothetical protein IJH01_02355 [Candidatus Saccharibacteria bacterium]|nr:hypothetical protein [Candidatus Saccharibacteria bacterium]